MRYSSCVRKLGLLGAMALALGCGEADGTRDTPSLAAGSGGQTADPSAGSGGGPDMAGGAGTSPTAGGGGTPTAGSTSGGSTSTGGQVSGGSAGSQAGSSAGGAGGSLVRLTDGKLHILPLGDSITLGVNGGYRNWLYATLTSDGYDVDVVGSLSDEYTEVADHDHEGHSGITTGGISDNIDTWLAATTAPDVVLLMIGTNDIAWWIAEPVSAVADRTFAIVDHLREKLPNAVIVVGTIAPEASAIVEPNENDRAALTVDYNEELKTRAAERDDSGTYVLLADVNAVLTVSDLYDGIHPTREAHDKVAEAWYDVLAPLLPPL